MSRPFGRAGVVGGAVVAALACRPMDGLDLHGPDDGSDWGSTPSSQPGETTTQPTGQTQRTTGPTRPTQPTSPRGTSSTGTSTPTPRQPTTAGGDPEGGRLAGITAAHNRTRTELGLPGLVWAPELAKFAQAWADKLEARGCELQHRPSRGADAQKYGENIYWASGMQSTPAGVVGDWAAERKNYDARTNKCRGVCGHYTQVVWRKSQRLGCGMATCGEAEVWVCNYDPPGNFVGQKPY